MKLNISLIRLLLLISSLLFSVYCFADTSDYVDPDWSLLFYHGTLEETSLLDVFNPSAKSGEENITSVELAYQLSPNNIIRHYFQPWITTISFNNNISYVDDPAGPIYEYDPFLMFRWEHFPWDKYVVNTWGIGWGVSYDTRVSTWEKHDSGNTKKLLNFLAFETTLALPRYPHLQLVLRLHHRSGAFGLYGADNAGSNFVGAGIRYLF